MLNILLNTPWWAYLILVLLCYSGIKALSPTREGKFSFLLTTLAFICLSLYSLTTLTLEPALLIACWLVAAILGALMAQVIFSRNGVVLDDPETGLILPGSIKPLIIYLILFAVDYYFGYQNDAHPERAATLEMLLIKASTLGFFSGLFSGRGFKYYRTLLALQAQPSKGGPQRNALGLK
ncbi:DUF6622 family protein [Pseudomonas sp. B21-053]|uniref:DUF6622 family protein n=1 Tax=Pseudomonas sp. B21-053 TaxID=2895493 RepID=UPI002232241C|nr:DUF6622 family protein [Pseudomonas sp. B21-053]UZE10966.1 hypothetical protein LOY68_26290 [Pseudomonas sp. B21-053]